MNAIRRLLLAFLLLPWPAYPFAAKAADECVILLHGLWRSKFSMKSLEWELVDQGYRVVNFSYPSTTHPIEELAVIAVEQGLQGCREHGSAKISFVTHSLGGILIRQYLAGHEIPELHRVVMIAPPNQGSQLADYVTSFSVTNRIQPPAVRQLGTDVKSIPRQLGPVDFELGVIAGTTNMRPFTPGAPNEKSDGTVAVWETKVDGMQDFVELPATHTFITWNTEVLEQVVSFLRNGRFLHKAN
jgi:triacylglycerol lipase